MKVGLTFIGVIAILFTVAVWQDHLNSLEYRLRNCTETSDNSGYIGFRCPVNHYAPVSVYVPYSERADVVNDMSPDDSGNGSM